MSASDQISEAFDLRDYQLGQNQLFKGTFTNVYVAKEKGRGRIFAIKSVNKSRLTDGKLLETELEVRAKNASQWIQGFHSVIQNPTRTYFIVEYLPGGNFASLLQKNGGYLDEEVAMFYLGELLMGIHAVHSIGFAHRNVRPENILLDGHGHIKLSGFGSCSKIVNGKVSSQITVDSASYEAPEVLRTLGNTTFTYGIECDYWSLGVIAFEVITGVHPFKSSSPLSAFKKIAATKKRGAIKIPAKVSLDCKEFISSLLLEQNERLGYNDCVTHSFFNELIWDELINKTAPIKPNIKKEEIQDLLDDDNDDDVENSTCLERRPNILNQTFIHSPKNGTIQDENKGKQHEWTIADVVNASTNSTISKSRMAKEEEEFKSELHIKTQQLNEKLELLDEIQTLKTQLQKSSETLESTEKKLTVSKNENKRLKTELQQVDAELSHEKKSRESLETRLSKMQIQMNKSVANLSIMRAPPSAKSIVGESDEMFELREQNAQLSTANYEKDDMILELTVQLRILQHELRVQNLHNKCLIRREDLSSNIFPQPWLETIKDMELDIKKLRTLVSQKPNTEKGNGGSKEEMIQFIEKATQKLGDITNDVEKNRAACETNLENVRIKRREFSESIAEIQTSLQKALEEYSEIETNLEN